MTKSKLLEKLSYIVVVLHLIYFLVFPFFLSFQLHYKGLLRNSGWDRLLTPMNAAYEKLPIYQRYIDWTIRTSEELLAK